MLGKVELPVLDLRALFNSGIITGRSHGVSNFFQIPSEYASYLPPILRVSDWDKPVGPVVVDSEGICYLVLLNEERDRCKKRTDEIDGLQLLVDSIWKEGRADLFEFPKFCAVDFLCFKVIAAPMERWIENEPGYVPFLSSSVWTHPQELLRWELANPEAAQALGELSKHIPGSGKYPFPSSENSCSFNILLAVTKQKIALHCPVGLRTDSPPSPETILVIVDAITNFECPVSSPLVFRSLLRRHGFRVRHIGKLLLDLKFPILKEIVVREMIGRSAKWYLRKLLADSWTQGTLTMSHPSIKHLLSDAEVEKLLIDDAARYFSVPFSELAPFVTGLNLFNVKYVRSDFISLENRTLFPHSDILGLGKSPGFFPSVKCVIPRPSPVVVDPAVTSPFDALPLSYAAKLFELETAMASGDFLRAVVTIGELVDVIMKMRAIEPSNVNKEQMRIKVLALCEAARVMVHQDLLVPPLITHAVLDCAPSFALFTHLKNEIINVEGEKNCLTLLSLESSMAEHLFESDPGTAVKLLSHVAERAEKWLGAQHPVTIASWVRKGQTIKRMIAEPRGEDPPVNLQIILQDGIKCLNKAIKACGLIPPSSAGPVIDQASLSYHLLAIFYMWNGQHGNAVERSREGLVHIEKVFGILHPRYLNSAFLHAKLLEFYAASIQDTVLALGAAREAVELLERILDSLQDLSSSCEADTDVVKELVKLFGEDFIDTELDMKRKLAITALLLKLNVWLLDPCVAADLLDLVVADQLSGIKGVLVLPHRSAVKEAVTTSLRNKLGESKLHSNLPVLEFSSALPESVMKCCQMALLEKSKGTPVTDWFKSFRQETLRTMGETENFESVQNKELLTSLFLVFVYIATPDEVYAGPLASPLVPRTVPLIKEAASMGIIYRDWERSAVLYSIDHGINPLSIQQ